MSIVFHCSFVLFQMFVSAGADINRRTYEDESVLGRAVYCGYPDIIQYLIEELSLDPDEVCRDGLTPVALAIENNDTATLQVLIECNARISNDILPKVASLGRLDMWKFICSLRKKVDINFKDKYGKSPLYIAVQKGYKDIVKHIINRKGMPKTALKTKDRLGRNLLFAAIDSGSYDMFLFLLEKLKAELLLGDLINEKDLYCGKERLFTVTNKDHGIHSYSFIEVKRIYLNTFAKSLKEGGPIDIAR